MKHIHPTENLMEAVVERRNMIRAYEQVVRNQGSAGVDGMTVAELAGYLRTNWEKLKEQLLAGSYRPRAVLGILN